MEYLKNHPFAVQAHFEHSIVLTFAVPKEELEDKIPPCLTLDLFQDKWAFLTVALVQTTALRPKGFPKIVGDNFFLIGYRLFVKYTNNEGKKLRGLYILKSETNSKKMEILGNIFTHYNYSTVDINQQLSHQKLTISSTKAKLNLTVDLNTENVQLPTNSPFANWKEARRFAGPLPFTFTYDAKDNSVLIIEGRRENWVPQPLAVNSFTTGFIDDQQIANAVLANAFIVKDIPYEWKKGKKEIWKQNAVPFKA